MRVELFWVERKYWGIGGILWFLGRYLFFSLFLVILKGFLSFGGCLERSL